MVDNVLYEYMESQLRLTPTQFYRYKFGSIDWDGRLTGVVGPRGVGKSTMLLQYILLHKDEGHHLLSLCKVSANRAEKQIKRLSN